MTFELTDSLADSILFAMEDQNAEWLLDAKTGGVVERAAAGDSEEDRYYSLPRWSSDDGYALLRDFTNTLHAPLARTELKRVLVSGRGVFRNFKQVVKSYPEVERRWHFYKDAQMRKRLHSWYNALRESWGLERLADREDDGDTADLVRHDFVFRVYDSSKDGNDIVAGANEVAGEYRGQFSGELGEAFAALWLRLSALADAAQKQGFVCHTQSDEFIGCLLFSFCPSSAKKTLTLTDFFVLQDYRGLGIGRELLSQCLAHLKDQGIQWVLIANTIVPEPMEPLLFEHGFRKVGSGFMADLFYDEEL